jgi:hypothetical protein
MKKILYTFAAYLFACPSFAQYDDYGDFAYIADTVYVEKKVEVEVPVYISTLDDITRQFGITYDDYVKQFLQYVRSQDSANRFSSRHIYLNYFLPMLEDEPGFPTQRMIDGIFSMYASPDTAFLNFAPAPLPDSLPKNNSNFDILFECRGDKNTDFFLQSPNLIDEYLVRLFKYVHEAKTQNNRAIKGVNFYFPDYSFKQKRAMAQFAKSVSIVIDSCRLKSIRGLKLYFSFNQQGADEIKYLSCLAEMADSVFVLNNTVNDRVFIPVTVVTYHDAKKYSLLYKIIDQFYLAHYNLQPFPHTSEALFWDADIINLIHSDYPNDNWEIYALVLIVIIGISILLFVMYWTIPAFSFFLHRNGDYMIVLILILIFEIFILFFYMLEAMSRNEIFSFSHENQNLLLLMPILLILIIPFLKIIRGKKNAP